MTVIKRGDPPNLRNVRRNVYHHYIRVDNPQSLIFLSGQLARDADGNIVGAGDMAEQARQCIRNMRTVPEAAGGTLDDIVSIVVYTTDMGSWCMDYVGKGWTRNAGQQLMLSPFLL